MDIETRALVWQTLTSVKGTLCCAAEVSASTLTAASSASAPWDTRSPPMARPAWVSDALVSTSSPSFASLVCVGFVFTGNIRKFCIVKAAFALLM